MTEQLNHAVAVKALHDIREESSHLVNSGDLRVAGEARRDYLLASVCLQLLSGVEPETFTNTELAKLPTPDELNAPDSNATANTIVDPAPKQPTNADELVEQNSGIVFDEPKPDSDPDNVADTDHLTVDDLTNYSTAAAYGTGVASYGTGNSYSTAV